MKRRARPFLVLWHRWFGLVAGVWLLALAATGSVIVFYDELDTALNPDLHRVRPQGEFLPVQQWIAAVETARPDGIARYVNMPSRADSSVLVELSARPGFEDSDVDELSVFVDPYTAQILGERRHGVLSLDRRHIMTVIYELHIDLMLGETMIWFLGLVTFLWLIDHVISVWIAIPVLAKWARSFRIRFRAGGYKRTFDLHRASGLWMFPITLMLVISGLYFNWYEPVTHVVDRISPLTPRYVFTLPPVATPQVETPITLVDALSRAQQASDGARINMARLLPNQGVFEVRAYDARDIDPYGRRMIVIDAFNGAVLSDRHVMDGSAGDIFVEWQYPLHSGKAFGWFGRILIFLSGLGVVLLAVTGVKIWLSKRAASAREA